jgi:subtilisin family serine protease
MLGAMAGSFNPMRSYSVFLRVILLNLGGPLTAVLASSPGSLPDLLPFQPSGWSDKLVVATSAGTTTDSMTLTSADILYVDWAVLNNGSASTANSFTVALYLDGVLRTSWSCAALPAQYYTYIQDYALGWLSAGSHILQIAADSTGVIVESNESNNSYTKTITVSAALPAIRVAPLSVSFTGAPPSTVQSFSSSPSSSVTATSSSGTGSNQVSSTGADKLVDPLQIMQEFTNGPTIAVVVNVAGAAAQVAATDFRSRRSVQALQQEILKAQRQVLNSIPGAHLKLRHRFENLTSFSADVTAAGLIALQQHPQVLSIEPVYQLEPHLAQGIPLIHGTTYRSTYNGAGVAIAICDTGIDYNHQHLGGGGFPNSKVIGGYNFGDNNSDPLANGQAHGTACAGIAAGGPGTVGDYIGGVAFNAKLYALKITSGSTGNATSDALTAAWDWCVTHKNDNPSFPIVAISTSFGGGRYYTSCDTAVPSMTTAAQNAVAAGITVLASSGNDGYCDSIAWPACISSVIAVGAVYDASFGDFLPCLNAASCVSKIATSGCTTGYYCDDSTAADRVTSYSNSASILGLLAPGNDCYTLDISGAAGYASDDFYPSFGGTSAASPYAAGAVACLQTAAKALTGSFLSVDDVASRLISFGDAITDNKSGIAKPRINLEQAILSLPNSSQTFRVYNDGAGPLQINGVTTDAPAPWISVAPNVPFEILGKSYQDVTVTPDFTQAPAGQSAVRLIVNSTDSGNSPYPNGVYVTLLNTNNTPPTISAISAQLTSANVATGPIGFTVNDAETPAASLTLSASSSDTNLVPVANIAFGGSGTNRSVTVTPAANHSGSCGVTITVSDGNLTASSSFYLKINAVVAGESIFYNNSSFDGNDANPNSKDDNAIAGDKAALLLGSVGSFANCTSYSRGINGIMVDIAGLPGTPSGWDFQFKIGNDNNPSGWVLAPAPSAVAIRPNAGTNGSDRVTLVWPDRVIQKQWLEVTVLATTNTGLASPFVFFFGNAIGATDAAATGEADVLINDALRILNSLQVGVSVINPFDIDRDGSVLINDALISLNNLSAGPQALQWIDLSQVVLSSSFGQSKASTALLVSPKIERSGFLPAQ